MRFKQNGEPVSKTYHIIKDALSDCSTDYLESVVEVLGNKRIGDRIRDNGPGFMGLAAKYLVIERYYEKVRKIDVETLKMIAKRMRVCEEIGRYKKEKGLPIYVPEREREVLERVEKLAVKNKLPKGLATTLFTILMEESRRLQARI
jgi:chorismate mutase